MSIVCNQTDKQKLAEVKEDPFLFFFSYEWGMGSRFSNIAFGTRFVVLFAFVWLTCLSSVQDTLLGQGNENHSLASSARVPFAALLISLFAKMSLVKEKKKRKNRKFIAFCVKGSKMSNYRRYRPCLCLHFDCKINAAVTFRRTSVKSYRWQFSMIFQLSAVFSLILFNIWIKLILRLCRELRQQIEWR